MRISFAEGIPYRLAEQAHGLAARAKMALVQDANVAVTAAFRPDGINVGVSIGRAAGAGVPDHVHVHVLPRWAGDTNFMTAVAEARVLPESLAVSRYFSLGVGGCVVGPSSDDPTRRGPGS